jgi:hypothetical protein
LYAEIQPAKAECELAACNTLGIQQDAPPEGFCIAGLPPSDLTIQEMFLTYCASCAAPLGLTLGKKCGRCSTRYCGPACQKQHWEEGGHDKLCKTIKKAGGNDQYHANLNYKEAVAVAVKKCADDTKGQTCFICTQALHWKTKEGLVRGCSCRGTAGFAHVSCLAEQAKIWIAEAEENNLDDEVKGERWARWYTCGLCEQDYYGFVDCALGWACWKTYLGRPEEDLARRSAMSRIARGLAAVNHDEGALVVQEAELAMERRLGAPEERILSIQSNLANTIWALGRQEQGLKLEHDVYYGYLKLNGEEDGDTFAAANNYAISLTKLKRFEEAKALLRKTMPLARRILRDSHELTLLIRMNYATALYQDGSATLHDRREAVTTLEDTERTARRVLGGAHPTTKEVEARLQKARATLRAREAQSPGNLCEALGAI